MKENKQYNTFVKIPHIIIIVIDTTAKKRIREWGEKWKVGKIFLIWKKKQWFLVETINKNMYKMKRYVNLLEENKREK